MPSVCPSNIHILIPAYNAGATLERVLARIPALVRPRIAKYVVVDDGSTDHTEVVLDSLSREYANLTVLKHLVNRGYGAALKTLFDAAVADQAPLAVVLHADGQYSPEKIPDLLAPFDYGQADLVQGSRILGGGALAGGMPRYKFIANKCLTALENRGFGMRLAEYHSGYMAYRLRTLCTIPYHQLSDSFDFDLEMMVCGHVLGLRLKEVPIPTIYADEVSYLNPVKYGFDVLGVIWKYRRKYYHALLNKAVADAGRSGGQA